MIKLVVIVRAPVNPHYGLELPKTIHLLELDSSTLRNVPYIMYNELIARMILKCNPLYTYPKYIYLHV